MLNFVYIHNALKVLQDQGCPAPHLEVRELYRLHPGGLDIHHHVKPWDPVGKNELRAHHQLAVVQSLPIFHILLSLNTSRFPSMGESEIYRHFSILTLNPTNNFRGRT